MFLKCSTRKKDGKEHRSWSIVESRRLGRSVVQRHILYLGEINDSQRAACRRPLTSSTTTTARPVSARSFPTTARRPRRTRPPCRCSFPNSSFAAPHLGRVLAGRPTLARTPARHLLRRAPGPQSRGHGLGESPAPLDALPAALAGSEWRLHRHWFATTACADLLGVDERIAQDDTPSIAAWTDCSNIRTRFSPICASAGAICSARSSTCCSTI